VSSTAKQPHKRALRARLLVLVPLLFVVSLAGAQLPTGQSAIASGPAAADFEQLTTGDVNGQDGWTSGHGSSTCPLYDVGIVANTYGYPSFGSQSLRISNAITCGSYNDQTFSPSLTDEAGETSATTSTYSGGTRQSFFEAQWEFASTVPGSEQPGLSVVASPDRGDPSRMSWVQMVDTPSGLGLNFEDYQESIQDFVVTPIATGLDRTVPHTVKITMQFVDGPSNDVVKVYLDGALIHTGTSWEDYYRDWAGGIPAPVDSIMFRVAGTAAPANSGNGFLIDNFSSFTAPATAADLTGLSLSSGTLSPAFDPATTGYSASVDNATTSDVATASTGPGATAVVSGGSTLAVGDNTVTITVTAADGTTTKIYTVTITRAAPPVTPPVTPPPSAPIPPAPTPAPPASLGAPQNLIGSVQGGMLVLSWTPPAGNPGVAHYTVWQDDKAIGVTDGSTYQLSVPNPAIGDASIFGVSADDGKGTTSPMSPRLTRVPDLTGLTADQGRALTALRGFTVGTVTMELSNQTAGTVIGQDPALPAYRTLGTAIDTVVSLHEPAAAGLIVKVSASRRTLLATTHSFTPLVLTTIAAKATVSLTRNKETGATFATWSRQLRAGANYLTLSIPAHLKIELPGIYRLTFRVQAQGQSRLYSVPVRLGWRGLGPPLPRREADVLLVKTPALSDQFVRQLSARYVVRTADPGAVFTATHAPNERVGTVVLDAKEAGLDTIRHLHFVFPDLHIVALVSSPAAGRLATAAGASMSVVEPASADQLSALLDRALRTTLGR
jgi:hypothetical protein